MFLQQQYLLGFAAGVVAHLTYFKHGEHHLHAARWFYSLLAAALALPRLEQAILSQVSPPVQSISFAVSVSFLVGLYVSILVYRIAFHPLRNYPGPFLAKTSKLWSVWQNRISQNHLLVDGLHQKYGDFVRTGPSELTIFVPDAIQVIDGPKNACNRAEWYDIMYPLRSIVLGRDKAQHDQRRRVWETAYNRTALNTYDDRIREHASGFLDWLAVRVGEVIPINEACGWYSFSTMTELALGEPFDLFNSDKSRPIVKTMHTFTSLLGPLSGVPWFFILAIRLPGISTAFTRYINLCKDIIRKRINSPTVLEDTDTTARLISHSIKNDRLAEDLPWLHGDAMTVIVAGSDSVQLTLTWSLFYLAKHSRYQQALLDELAEIEAPNLELLSQQPLLNAFITEVTRLHPVVPTGSLRKTESTIVVNGHIIPPNTTISIAKWTIARREEYFERAKEFIPERWTTKPWMVKNLAAYSPFGLGRYACVGKNLAYRELSCAISEIVSAFHIRLADGETGHRIANESRDCFTAVAGPVKLSFTKRA